MVAIDVRTFRLLHVACVLCGDSVFFEPSLQRQI